MSFRHSVTDIPLPCSPKYRQRQPGLNVEKNSYPKVPHGNSKPSEKKDVFTPRENLDARLNKLMLGEDLPLFLHEFADEWQKEKIRRKKTEEFKTCSTNEINPEKLNQLLEEGACKDGMDMVSDDSYTSQGTRTESLKKYLKRLHGRHSVKDKISDKVKEIVADELRNKLRQDIMNQMIDKQLDIWYSKHVIDIS